MVFRALRAFVLVLILLGMTAGVANAQTASPAAPDTPSQAPTPTITPPGVTWATIRQDTPEERAAFLQQRAISQGLRVVSDVPPLPQQRITPPALRQP
jgi:hypothetical protein